MALYNRLIPIISRELPLLYTAVCSYLIVPPVADRNQLKSALDVPLLLRLVKCSEEEELYEVLCFHMTSARVERAVQQLREAGLHEEGEKLLTDAANAQQQRGASLMGVTTNAFRSLKGLFS